MRTTVLIWLRFSMRSPSKSPIDIMASTLYCTFVLMYVNKMLRENSTTVRYVRSLSSQNFRLVVRWDEPGSKNICLFSCGTIFIHYSTCSTVYLTHVAIQYCTVVTFEWLIQWMPMKFRRSATSSRRGLQPSTNHFPSVLHSYILACFFEKMRDPFYSSPPQVYLFK